MNVIRATGEDCYLTTFHNRFGLFWVLELVKPTGKILLDSNIGGARVGSHY